MNIYIAVLIVTAIISLLGYLWLSMVAFKRSIPWGLLVLLLSPISAIVFAVMYWYDARKAFVVYISSFLLCAVSAVLIIGNVGMGNMQEISTRMHSGALTPAEAYQLVNNRLSHPGSADLFAQTTPDQMVKPDMAGVEAGTTAAMTEEQKQAQSQVAAVTQTDSIANVQAAKPQAAATQMPLPEPATMDDVKSAQKTAESAPLKNEKEAPKQETGQAAPAPKQAEAKKDAEKTAKKASDKNVPLVKIAVPDPLAQKPYVPPPNTTHVRLSRISHYVGRYFIISLKDGTERRGLLKQVTSTHLLLDRKLYGGNLRYKIRKTQVKKISMLTRLPDER